jgi:hypothetical protein
MSADTARHNWRGRGTITDRPRTDPYRSVDVVLGWPLHYSYSPGEVIDTKGLDALSKIVEVLARKR